jgi:Fe2+ transport system protein FeoA
MGVLPGTHVTVVRTGPLGGDPIELAVDGGQSIALRGKEARGLECELIAIPLGALAHSGDTGVYRIKALLGGQGLRHKLAQRGLAVGDRITLVQRRPLRVRILPQGPELGLGRGEADKILLEPVSGDDAHG